MKASIEEAARVVRENVEALAIQAARVHGAYIDIKTTTAGEMSLMGACAIASWVLWKALRQAGFSDAVFVRGWYHGSIHCWVEVDGCVVDVTATQFGVGTAVSFHPVGQNEGYQKLSPRDWSGEARLNEVAEAHVKTWYDGQSPFEPRYQDDLAVIQGLAVDAALDPELEAA